MPVGAAETEGIDTDHDGAVGERLACRLHLHGAAVEVDFQIGRQEVPRDRREGASLHHHDDLEQRAGEGGRLQVPDVALDAGHAQRDLAFDAAEGLGDGIPLDSVAHDGACGMRLDVVEIPRPQPGPSTGAAHQFDLRMAGRCGDVPALREPAAVVGGPRRIDRGGFDHRVDVVPFPFGRFQRLDGENEGPFGTHVAVGVGIERVTPAVGADDAEGIEGDAAPGRTQIGRGSHQRAVAVALNDRVDRRVQGRKRSGTGRGTRNRRPHQVQVVGNAIGQHRGVDAQDGELVGPVHRPPIGRRSHLGPDEDARGTIAQRVKIPPGPFAGFPGASQQHADLGIHVRHFVERHAEETRVHPLLAIVPDQPLVGAPESARAGESTDRPIPSAVAAGDGFPHDFAFPQQAPEVAVRENAAGHAIAVPDDGDGTGGGRRIRFHLRNTSAGRINLAAHGKTPCGIGSATHPGRTVWIVRSHCNDSITEYLPAAPGEPAGKPERATWSRRTPAWRCPRSRTSFAGPASAGP